MSIESYPSPNGVLTSLIWRKTMSGGETSLSGYDNASQALSYTPGQEQVYLNGILLVRGDDYTATNGTSITGLSALAASDFVQVNCYNNFSVASVPTTSLTGTVTNAQLANSAITINGSAISLGGTVTLAGDIESVTATSPLTGGGSTGALTVGIQEASTSQRGSVQLSDSTSTTSSVLAATPTAVKSAYDLANGAIPKTLTTTTGDIIYASAANTPARLGIGTTDQVLKVTAGVPAWATPSAPAFVGASAYVNSGSVTYAANVEKILDATSEEFDTDGFHDNSTNPSRMTIPAGKNGKYLITAHHRTASGGDYAYLFLYKNGSRVTNGLESAQSARQSALAGNNTVVNFAVVIDAVATDYFYITFQSSFAATSNTWFRYAITYLGA